MKNKALLLIMLIQFICITITNAQDTTRIRLECGYVRPSESTNNNKIGLPPPPTMDDKIRDYINTHPVSTNDYIIPVVVHVFNSGQTVGTGTNINYDQIKWAINALNAGFGKKYTNYNNVISGTNGTYSDDTHIRFCLAKTPTVGRSWYNANEPGVIRYTVPASDHALNPDLSYADQLEIKKWTHQTTTDFPYNNFLNIWIVNSIKDANNPNAVIGGFATMVNSSAHINGVVIIASVFGDNSVKSVSGGPFLNSMYDHDNGKVLVHEVGHYFSLYHTFDGTPYTTGGNPGCSGESATKALTEGDQVFDTPPSSCGDTYSNCGYNFNTCSETYAPYTSYGNTTVNVNDQYENFMSYSYDYQTNTFTRGQHARMDAILNISDRNQLWTPTNLANAGVQVQNGKCNCNLLSATFIFSPSKPCPGTLVNFMLPFDVASLGAVSWSWNFGDPASGANNVSALTNPSHTFNNAGTYTITLTVTDPWGKTDTKTQTITVAKPSAVISSYQTSSVCDGSTQNLCITLTGTPPFTITIKDQSGITKTYTNILYSSVNIPVTPTLSNKSFTITSVIDNVCSNTSTSTATFNVINCCPSIITNGDFSADYSGFGSQHTYSTCFNPGNFYVANFSNNLSLTGNCGKWNKINGLVDHGKSMMFDGFGSTTDPNFPNNTPKNHVELWYQNVNLTANTNYFISFFSSNNFFGYGQFAGGTIPKNLQFQIKIDGNLLPTVFTASQAVNSILWLQHNLTWNSGALAGSHKIAICQTINFDGMPFDFLIDDISMRPAVPTVNAGADKSVCLGSGATLSATGTGSSYTWNPGNINAPTATVYPTTNTSYTVIVNNGLGCSASDVVNVSIKGNPAFISMTCTNVVCANELQSVFTGKDINLYRWNITGPNAINWTSPNFNGTPGVNNYAINFANYVSGLVQGTYTITLYMSNCEGTSFSAVSTCTSYVSSTIISTTSINDFTITSPACATLSTYSASVNSANPGYWFIDEYNSSNILVASFGSFTGTSTNFGNFNFKRNTTYVIRHQVNSGPAHCMFVENKRTLNVSDCFCITCAQKTGTTKVEEVTLLHSFNLFPNPSNGNMTLEYSLETGHTGQVQLFDLAGKNISNYVFNSENNTLLINNDQLESGIYFYKIVVDGNLVSTEKLVIVK